jgi:hypothetical protein
MTEADDTVTALKSLVIMLLKNARQTSGAVESLRMLLEERGVFSGAQFEAAFVRAQTKLDDDFAQHMKLAMEDAHSATLLKILEKHEGKPQ